MNYRIIPVSYLNPKASIKKQQLGIIVKVNVAPRVSVKGILYFKGKFKVLEIPRTWNHSLHYPILKDIIEDGDYKIVNFDHLCYDRWLKERRIFNRII